MNCYLLSRIPNNLPIGSVCIHLTSLCIRCVSPSNIPGYQRPSHKQGRPRWPLWPLMSLQSRLGVAGAEWLVRHLFLFLSYCIRTLSVCDVFFFFCLTIPSYVLKYAFKRNWIFYTEGIPCKEQQQSSQFYSVIDPSHSCEMCLPLCLELPLNTGNFLQITPLQQCNVFTWFPPVLCHFKFLSNLFPQIKQTRLIFLLSRKHIRSVNVNVNIPIYCLTNITEK